MRRRRIAASIVAGLSLIVCAGWLLPASPEVEARGAYGGELAALHARLQTPRDWPTWCSWAAGRELKCSGPAEGVDAAVRWSDGSAIITASLPARGVWMDVQMASFSAKQAVLYERTAAATSIRWIHREHIGWNPLLRYVAWWRGRRLRAFLEQRLRDLTSVS